MKNKIIINKNWVVIFIIILFISGSFFPILIADHDNDIGFNKGITRKPFKPLKRITLVNFDKNSYVDDYSYLASIPASIFCEDNTMYCSPLMFYQPEGTYPKEDKYLFLNDYDSYHYFMQDWKNYCFENFDKASLININDNNINLNAKHITKITSEDPFSIANYIALDEWSFSKEVVLSVIQEDINEEKKQITTGQINGVISGGIEHEQLVIQRPYGPSFTSEDFHISSEYKFIDVDLWYPAFVSNAPLLQQLTNNQITNWINLIVGFKKAQGVTFPSVDMDLQIYCKYKKDWLYTAGSSSMAIHTGPIEQASSYVYNPGKWRIGVTNMPTEGGENDFVHYTPLRNFKIYGKTSDAFKNALGSVTEFNCDIKKYPGVELKIPDTPTFGCKNASITLTWHNHNVNLGLSLIGPTGEEIETVYEQNDNKQEINIHNLGECVQGEQYKVVVFTKKDLNKPVDFTVEYSWNQNNTRNMADSISSASEGAILSSIINTPMLYLKKDELTEQTKKVLLKLGIERIHLVDIGNHLQENIKNELRNIGTINNHFISLIDIYDAITKRTNQNDIIFSTIDPWSYWFYSDLSEELEPAGEYKKAFYFGPAAYASAIHGSPLLLIENHPELSSAATWHINFWRKHGDGFTKPPVAPLFLTGRKVYDFLDEIGLDKCDPESILTIAGQYDIGPSWTRMFAGVGNPGHIIGTPIDTSILISRNLLYPCLIFENPALKGPVELENGSKSTRVGPVQRIFTPTMGLSNLKIVRPSQVERYEHPILHTYGCYGYRFNERGSEYWGTTYMTRRGYTPGKDLSGLEIDQGTRLKYENKNGAYLPDLSEAEITPFYAKKAGYSNVFSSDFNITMKNLNQGVISWYMVLHGMPFDGGTLSWWYPLLPPKEKNPWRGYELYWGSTEEPDSALLSSKIGLLVGWFNPLFDPLGKGIFKTGLDIVPTKTAGYYDGLVGPYSFTAMFGKFRYLHSAKEINEKLENLHSMSFHANSCYIGCNFIQIAFMRHGSVLQELDPWSTSYWGGYAFQQTPKEYALGKTVGETYAQGITEIGPQYIFEENDTRIWWWDTSENVVLFSDPDLRVWIPQSTYEKKKKNHWKYEDISVVSYDNSLSINGHMPFGATKYPMEKRINIISQQMLIVILSLTIVIILIIIALIINKR